MYCTVSLSSENWDTYAGQDAVAGTSSNWEEEPHCEDPNFNVSLYLTHYFN